VRYRNAIAFAVALAPTLGASVCRVQAQAAKSDAAAAGIAIGKSVFVAAGCSACHGTQAQGTTLAPAIAPPPLELPAMIAYVRQPTGKMPPVPEATASDKQLADVFDFLQSIAPKAAPADELKGDADNGKKLFAAYGCYECHGRQGAGASTGPRIGPPAITLAAVLRYVRAPTGQMPPYTAKVVSDQDLADIYSYLKSFPTPRPAKDIPLLNP
jgi:mono/diheme cytochrome c family protein